MDGTSLGNSSCRQGEQATGDLFHSMGWAVPGCSNYIVIIGQDNNILIHQKDNNIIVIALTDCRLTITKLRFHHTR